MPLALAKSPASGVERRSRLIPWGVCQCTWDLGFCARLFQSGFLMRYMESQIRVALLCPGGVGKDSMAPPHDHSFVTCQDGEGQASLQGTNRVSVTGQNDIGVIRAINMYTHLISRLIIVT